MGSEVGSELSGGGLSSVWSALPGSSPPSPPDPTDALSRPLPTPPGLRHVSLVGGCISVSCDLPASSSAGDVPPSQSSGSVGSYSVGSGVGDGAAGLSLPSIWSAFSRLFQAEFVEIDSCK